MNALIQEMVSNPLATLLIIGNLILIESLLSVDNAAVLATMVMDLPVQQRKKALKYGILGAYLFRGICLFLASFLVKIWWLKALGGVYLIYLVLDWSAKKRMKKMGKAGLHKDDSWLYRKTVGRLGDFWAVVISVEIMDLAFSMDNVFAAVAFSHNILIILCGVFIGILAMRFVAQGFVKLMERYPFLEGSAYLVIGVLGIKLVLSLYEHFAPESETSKMLGSHEVDWLTSIITISIFFVPMLTSILFNVPKKEKQ
ncbi:MAG: Integral rane protein TerC [Flavipsychrobacter sp.]|nr:Integral rane protein TerC [Flavipsychrobacter sp.]